MKQIKIKKYMFSKVILILTVLITASIITFLMISEKYKQAGDMQSYKSAKVIVNEAQSFIEDNFSNLKTPSAAREMKKILDKNELQVQVLDLDGHNIYCSDPAKADDNIINIKYIDSETPDTINYVSPVTINQKVIGNSVFSIPKRELALNNSYSIIVCFIPLILAILLCSTLLIRMFGFTKSRILAPINDLNTFTDNIAKGKFKNKLKYEIDSEITKLCSGFELMQEELEYSLEVQNKLERERKELIACISHDLRTPLSSIKAYVGAIKDGYAEDTVTMQKYVEIIDNKTDIILKLIDDFFEQSKAELGELRIRKSPHYSKEFFDRLIEAYSVEFLKKNIKFTVDTEIPEVLINIDSLKMEQVVFNLFQNTMKYTGAGGNVHFGVNSVKDVLSVYIKDDGVGISSFDIPYIFEKFYRGEKEKSKEYEDGTGLGLYICKYIVEAHGGDIFVESRLGEGTTFAFTIPKI